MWWFLSFFTNIGTPAAEFIGSVIVEGDNLPEAAQNAWDMDINPGGQVTGRPYPEELLPPTEFRDRLLAPPEASVAYAYIERAIIKQSGTRIDN